MKIGKVISLLVLAAFSARAWATDMNAVRVPMSAESATVATNNASKIVQGINSYSTNTLSASMLGSSAVLTNRTLTAGDGMSGGGNLSADRSFAVDGSVVRTNTDIFMATITNLIAGSNIGLTNNGHQWTITAAPGTGEANTASTAGGTYALTLPKSGIDLPLLGLTPTAPITISTNATEATFGFDGSTTFNAGGATNLNLAETTGTLSSNHLDSAQVVLTDNLIHLLAITNIVAGANISVTNNGHAWTIAGVGSSGDAVLANSQTWTGTNTFNSMTDLGKLQIVTNHWGSEITLAKVNPSSGFPTLTVQGAAAMQFTFSNTVNIDTPGYTLIVNAGTLGDQQINGSTSFQRIGGFEGYVEMANGHGLEPSSILLAASTNYGTIPFPRMSIPARNNIATPVAGLMIFNTNDMKINFYDGTGWQAVTSTNMY